MDAATTAAPPNGERSKQQQQQQQQQHQHQKPAQLSFPLPRAPNARVNLHLTVHPTSLLLFVTTTSPEHDAGVAAPVGSFVYAMPNRTTTTNPATAQPLSTALYPQTPTLDLATRLAKILARRTARPTYVGNSTSFSSAGAGGNVEEEMEGLARVVEVVVEEVRRVDEAAAAGVGAAAAGA
ncbi:uncharacterized protein BKCO1_660005 [Diplodia corticola]|uniref:Uncharacterized protein n=1 Tax=Diplodia corticola TaxID=236234 RepID=A0A1J9QNV7_9PEZI|nr:uncharacterized protein BKCO1_660005 [Diplodia corticola]OJD30128.1 hypothetical protein BKCO1_660005 [Diplodia corticola]